ncbi:MAG TPA: DUF3883 domain-containing protein [Geobacteraceae bacterium]|nr:DUF3883 domain-containing protein [Geobacteraceae bacterium]
MTDGSRLALIVGFYLSKYDNGALERLGYATFKEAYADIGAEFGVNPGSVKNKRDDFDPLFSNSRAGWHQRELGPSRLKTLHLLNELSFDALTGFVTDLIRDAGYRQSPEVKDVLEALKQEHHMGHHFVPRGATGRMAEELFLKWFQEGRTPFSGSIEDRRDDGCGYDFLIKEGALERYVEVKGLAENEGGVLLTDKEWQVAQGNVNYNLAIFMNLRESPALRLISNPASSLTPRRTVNLSVRVSWQVSAKELASGVQP